MIATDPTAVVIVANTTPETFEAAVKRYRPSVFYQISQIIRLAALFEVEESVRTLLFFKDKMVAAQKINQDLLSGVAVLTIVKASCKQDIEQVNAMLKFFIDENLSTLTALRAIYNYVTEYRFLTAIHLFRNPDFMLNVKVPVDIFKKSGV